MKGLLFYITLFLLILMFSVSANYFDYDLWARLIAGMGVIDGCHVLTADFLSYTPVHTWWDHEWGAGVIFYSVLKIFGPYSLIILQSLMFFGIFFTASRVAKLRGANPDILFYFFAIMAIMPTLNHPIRCHMFSFLFFTIFIYILEKVRRENSKLIYLIPVIILFWNNIHGGVVSGLGLLFMYALGEFLNGKPFKKYLFTLLASLPVLFINPWGYDYIKFLLMANTMKRPDIVEWWGIFEKIHKYNYMTFKLFLAAMLALEGFKQFTALKNGLKSWYKNTDKTKWIIILTTTYLAISHVKLMPFFIIVAICFMYEDLTVKIKIPQKAIYALLLFLSLFTFITKDFSIPIGTSHYPLRAVEFVKINNIKGKILTNFGYGSYVSYKLYPDNLIFMDGRYEEVYYDYMVPLLKNFYLVNQGWDDVLKYFTPDVMIIENSYPVYEVLKKSSDWKVVFEGEGFGVFLPSAVPKRDYKQPSDDMNYYKNTLFDTDIKF